MSTKQFICIALFLFGCLGCGFFVHRFLTVGTEGSLLALISCGAVCFVAGFEFAEDL